MQSNQRIAELMVQLMAGKSLQQTVVEKKYQISRRTCQRDFSYIREALSEYAAGSLIEHQGTYRIVRQSDEADFEMTLATSNILLGSRALSQSELTTTLNYLQRSLSPEMQAVVRQQLTISRGSYTPLAWSKPLLARLRTVAACIDNTQKMVFTYLSSQNKEQRPIVHHAQPVAVFFETHYFYAAMFSEEHDGYWLYRLDRIVDILKTTAGDKLDYAERYSLQDHRHQTYLLDTGSLTKIRFIYRNYIQTVLDHFPNSRVVQNNQDGSYVVEAYVKVDGAMLWLLSQGAALKVLSPTSLVKRMKSVLTAARNQYDQ